MRFFGWNLLGRARYDTHSVRSSECDDDICLAAFVAHGLQKCDMRGDNVGFTELDYLGEVDAQTFIPLLGRTLVRASDRVGAVLWPPCLDMVRCIDISH